MPVDRLNFVLPRPDAAGFHPGSLLDDVILPERRLADGAVVVNAAPAADDAAMTHVTVDVYT